MRRSRVCGVIQKLRIAGHVGAQGGKMGDYSLDVVHSLDRDTKVYTKVGARGGLHLYRATGGHWCISGTANMISGSDSSFITSTTASSSPLDLTWKCADCGTFHLDSLLTVREVSEAALDCERAADDADVAADELLVVVSAAADGSAYDAVDAAVLTARAAADAAADSSLDARYEAAAAAGILEEEAAAASKTKTKTTKNEGTRDDEEEVWNRRMEEVVKVRTDEPSADSTNGNTSVTPSNASHAVPARGDDALVLALALGRGKTSVATFTAEEDSLARSAAGVSTAVSSSSSQVMKLADDGNGTAQSETGGGGVSASVHEVIAKGAKKRKKTKKVARRKKKVVATMRQPREVAKQKKQAVARKKKIAAKVKVVKKKKKKMVKKKKKKVVDDDDDEVDAPLTAAAAAREAHAPSADAVYISAFWKASVAVVGKNKGRTLYTNTTSSPRKTTWTMVSFQF